jgi:hypothetical protein
MFLSQLLLLTLILLNELVGILECDALLQRLLLDHFAKSLALFFCHAILCTVDV